MVKKDMVNHPPHYAFGNYETIDVIEAWGLPYHLGNVVKYVSRAKRKGKEIEDLKKAAWYLDRYIEMIEKTPEPPCLFNIEAGAAWFQDSHRSA